LVAVCTGTGKMKSLREYLDRPAISGKDDRGGAMALLVSTELAFAEREGKVRIAAEKS
jgi:unsaturated rhamnogalacturonyl hydrolase